MSVTTVENKINVRSASSCRHENVMVTIVQLSLDLWALLSYHW